MRSKTTEGKGVVNQGLETTRLRKHLALLRSELGIFQKGPHLRWPALSPHATATGSPLDPNDPTLQVDLLDPVAGVALGRCCHRAGRGELTRKHRNPITSDHREHET